MNLTTLGCCCLVAKLFSTYCDPMDYNMSGFPVLHYCLELAQSHVHRVHNAIQPSHSTAPFSFWPQSFPTSGSFLMSSLFALGGQSIGASASASVLPMNIENLFPLTGWISGCPTDFQESSSGENKMAKE